MKEKREQGKDGSVEEKMFGSMPVCMVREGGGGTTI